MKKVLFATTALVASAGIASAEVAVTGSAEMGIVGGNTDDLTTTTREDRVRFHQDVEVTFTMSGETDNGLTFGTSVQLDEGGTAGAGTSTDDHGGVAVFISGDFGTLTMGDTDGAFDWAMTEVALAGGSINDAETGHSGYNGNAGLDGTHDGQVVRYDHSVGDFSFAVSVEADDGINSASLLGAGAPTSDPVFGIGFKYSADLGGTTLGIGLGYQTVGDHVRTVGGVPTAFTAGDIVGISLNAAMDNGVTVGLNYSDGSLTTGGVKTSASHIGIGVGYTMDALAIGFNWGQYDVGGATTDGFGIAATYDLGGGASIQFGYGTGGSPSVDSFSLGVAMSF